MIADGLYRNLTYKIIGALFEVHKELGSVHKEIIYHKALALELKNRNLPRRPVPTKAGAGPDFSRGPRLQAGSRKKRSCASKAVELHHYICNYLCME